ncbi:MAG: hypothetical protein A2W05_11490 [Candidatus Schekmanbacteria bacterium RBG_16_38_10]|uniref:Plasmid stabilization protein n=1 Tax=Candidatus Schekmanbacteria bacterium RBG_16_38_10 TaxID=1817879 RepID=A0A1F7S3B7_9BACT|nr:MAG: hypothetical protein A2W05_11490 [Candidatus Schekmanbacteria bacterium RBG_16_38_10]
MYKIILHKHVIKFYKKAVRDRQDRIEKAIADISENPYHGIHIKKLQGELSTMYRYRIGGVRILYEIHEEIKTVRIKVIESRGQVYK